MGRGDVDGPAAGDVDGPAVGVDGPAVGAVEGPAVGVVDGPTPCSRMRLLAYRLGCLLDVALLAARASPGPCVYMTGG